MDDFPREIVHAAAAGAMNVTKIHLAATATPIFRVAGARAGAAGLAEAAEIFLVAAAEKICAAAGGRIASVIGDFPRVNASAAAAMPAFAGAKSAAGPAPRSNAAAATRSPVTSGFGAEKS